MRIDVLKCLIEIEKTGSQRKAADRLYISQQGLNKAIMALESELDVQIFERNHQGVHLTEYGKIVLDNSKNILTHYNKMIDEIEEKKHSNNSTEPPPILYTTSYTMTTAVPQFQALTDFFKTSSIQEIPLHSLLNALNDKEENVVILLELFSPSDTKKEILEKYEFIPLLQTKVGVSWCNKYPFITGPSISAASLRDVPLIRFQTADTQEMYAKIFRDYPMGKTVMTTSHQRLMIEWEKQGKGVCLSDSYANFIRSVNNKNSSFVAIEDTSVVDIGFAYSKNTNLSHKNIAYLEEFARAFKELNKAYIQVFKRKYGQE